MFNRKWKVERIKMNQKPQLLKLPPHMDWCCLDSEFYRKYSGDPNNLVVMDYEAICAGVDPGRFGGQVGMNSAGKLVIEIWDFDRSQPPSEWEIHLLTHEPERVDSGLLPPPGA